MLLTSEERQRFAEWLRQDIASNKALVEQLKAMPMMQLIHKRKAVLVMAEEVVLRELLNVEEQSIGGKDA